jgi:hypothetical protein
MMHLADGIKQLSGRPLCVSIITAENGAALLAASVQGDVEATMLLRAIVDSATWIKRQAHRKPALCVSCPQAIRRVTPAMIFGVVAPTTPTIGHGLGFAFCAQCAEHPDELMAKAAEALRRFWPDLRPLVVTHPAGGRA